MSEIREVAEFVIELIEFYRLCPGRNQCDHCPYCADGHDYWGCTIDPRHRG